MVVSPILLQRQCFSIEVTHPYAKFRSSNHRFRQNAILLSEHINFCGALFHSDEIDRNCLQLSYAALFFNLIHISLTFMERNVGTALSCSDKNHFEASISRNTNFKKWHLEMETALFSKTPGRCALLSSGRHDGQAHPDQKTVKFTNSPPPGYGQFTAVKKVYADQFQVAVSRELSTRALLLALTKIYTLFLYEL